MMFLVMAAAEGSAARSIDGHWATEGRKAVIAIHACGDTTCGQIVSALPQLDGTVSRDAGNPDPTLRGRPLAGVRLLDGFVYARGAWSGGRIYNPEDGRRYSASMKLGRDGRLQVQGCVLFFCKTQYWTRAVP
jgi:uncharacterized protein (DUF2147 family)